MTRATQDTATGRDASRTGLSPSTARLSSRLRSRNALRHRGPTTPLGPEPEGFGLFPGRSPLLGESFLFSLPPGTKMFQFPGFASLNIAGIAGLQPAGLSHSEIRGSQVTCTLPRLIAAYRVLHRLREPRHPPCALALFLARNSPPKKGEASILSDGPHTAETRRGPALLLLLLLLLVQHAKERPAPAQSRAKGEHRGIEPRERAGRRKAHPLLLPQEKRGGNLYRRKQTWQGGTGLPSPPERRCSSRTFRYGYLVTT